MPQTIKDSEGNEVEVFSAEELEAQKQEAIDAFKVEYPDKTEELAELQEKLKETEEELTKAKGKDQNFGTLRKAKEDAEKKVEDILKGVDEKINTVKKEVLEGVMQNHKNKTLEALVGEDAELKKKVELEYGRLSDVASTEEQITKKLKDAFILATAKEPDGINANIYGSGNVGRVYINSQSPKFSAEEKELGSKFGLTDKDFK